ncbi:CxC2 domain-containing protein [Mycena chlorophos]|uniref:CxC2 domain-containing protein n=1 Tax=Mycena chlorophos TaxID=658473 RepID=A0A8H6RWF5_MYCCL|nr:CxC2 domain-containing protein [Mycena chlorophos]
MSFRQQRKRAAMVPDAPHKRAKALHDPHEHVIALSNLAGPSSQPIDAGAERVSTDMRRSYPDPLRLAPTSPLKRIAQSQSQAVPASLPANEMYIMGEGDDDWVDAELKAKKSAAVPRILRPAPFTNGAIRVATTTFAPSFGVTDVAELASAVLSAAKRKTPRCTAAEIASMRNSSVVSAASLNTLITRSIGLSAGPEFTFRSMLAQRCPQPVAARKDFVVVHTNGVHEVGLDFCGCYTGARPHFDQLLRAGWFPSTDHSPRTCVSLVCLEQYHALSLQAKVSPHRFYQTLEILTDATGIKPPDRYQIFLRIDREYRHLIMLKRGGRGHDPAGASGTKSGELALRCPACPRPNVNIPDDWENEPSASSCKYAMNLAFDACFRLKRRDISNEIRDPGLGTGLSYFVEQAPYRKYIETIKDQKEMSSCSKLAAIDHANTKFARGYAVTGVVMGVCTRHEFVQPNGVADLQRGERYGNVDWVFLSILRHLELHLRFLISYDIACQWCKRLFERVDALPFLLSLVLVSTLFRFVVPKLHILGHIAKCQAEFSLNYTPGSGQADGESIERAWSNIGACGANTRAILYVGALIKRSSKRERQHDAFLEFSVHQEERVPAWKAMVVAYEADDKNDNPYEPKVEGMSESQVRAQLEEAEEEDEKNGRWQPISEISPATFLVELLDIEHEQRRVGAQAELRKSKVVLATTSIRSMRKRLNKRIGRLRTMQATYTPAALQKLKNLNLPQDEPAEKIPLLSPSALDPASQANGGCVEGLVDMEVLLRKGQCRSALTQLRNQLHVKRRLLIYKSNHTRAQAMNTRARAVVERNEARILLASLKFQTAWLALLRVLGNEQQLPWPRLKKSDIRCLEDSEELALREQREKRAAIKRAENARILAEAGIGARLVSESSDEDESDEDEDEDETSDAPMDDVFVAGTPVTGVGLASGGAVQQGESRRTPSWIWTHAERDGTDLSFEEGLRIEWTKAWARDRRWSEEVVILAEETRRVPLSFDHHANIWLQRAELVTGREQLTNDECEGLVAYAVSQSDTFHNLARPSRGLCDDAANTQRRAKAKILEVVHGIAGRHDVVAEQIEQQIDERELGNESDEEEDGED